LPSQPKAHCENFDPSTPMTTFIGLLLCAKDSIEPMR
jgi:hypothetical protein